MSTSTLSDDKKPVNEPRKLPLADADAELRDQIPAKLLDVCEEDNIGQRVVAIWEAANVNRQEWLDRQQLFLADWDEFLESTAEGPFTGASTLHIPMPLQVAKTMHARFMQALLGVEPYFSVKARREDAVERAEMVTDVMHYTLKDWCNYRRGIDETIDIWLWDWVTVGSAILKARWDCTYTRFMDVQTVQQIKTVTKILDDGTRVQVPTPVPKQVEKAITKKVFEGPVLEHRNIEDIIIVGGNGDPQLADFVGDRVWLTASELWTNADRKIFRKDIVEKIIQGGPDFVGGSSASMLKQRRLENNGQAMLDVDYDLDRYEIIEAYMKLDVDGSGINSDVVVWVHKRTREILRATYLHRVNSAGERPFFKIDFHKRSNQEYGIGIVEMVHPLSKEMDAIHNLRIDYGMISTMPFGFYRPTSSIDPQIIELEPGCLIPVDNPTQDVYFPNLGNRTAFGFQEEQALQGMVERLTGISDINLGVMSGTQGATRTATGARALLGESNANLDVYMRRMGRGWKTALQHLLHMLQQRIPKGLSFRVTGEAGNDYWRWIKDQSDIAGEFDFEVSNNSANSNKAIQQDVALQVLQLMLNPLLIQTGIVSAGNIYEAVKNHLKQLGVKDFGKFCTKPPQWQHMLTPEDEANRILRGIPVPVTAEMDHAGFIAYFKEIYDNDELLGQFSQQQTVMLASQAQRHQQMLAAMEQMAAQAAVGSQMQQNSQAAAGQSSPGMSPVMGQAGAPAQAANGAFPEQG